MFNLYIDDEKVFSLNPFLFCDFEIVDIFTEVIKEYRRIYENSFNIEVENETEYLCYGGIANEVEKELKNIFIKKSV